MNKNVDWFFNNVNTNWHEEYKTLRKIIIDCEGLVEELKWGCPCYTLQKSNIVLIHGFKNYCALLFMKGALLKDNNKILVQQTENVQSARQIRFTNSKEIIEQEFIIKTYIKQAIDIEKIGLKVEFKKPTEFRVSIEFQNKLNNNATLKTAFEMLTPGRQRQYLLHFSAPKLAKTRESRVEKCFAQIIAGKGLEE
jgi:uncharacterized protein YdeI (YjbR/CyaY-like superfamily)